MTVSPIDILNGFHDVWGFVILKDEEIGGKHYRENQVCIGPESIMQSHACEEIYDPAKVQHDDHSN
jgi:hypothetical protein